MFDMNNNEWVDENYIRELFDEFKEKHEKEVLDSIKIYRITQEAMKTDMSSLIDFSEMLLDFDKQLALLCNEGCVFIGSTIFKEEPVYYTAKKIEGRWMFQEIKRK